MENNAENTNKIIKEEINMYYMATLVIDGHILDEYFVIFDSRINSKFGEISTTLYNKYANKIDEFINQKKMISISINPVCLHALYRDDVLLEFLDNCKQLQNKVYRISYKVPKGIQVFKINEDICILARRYFIDNDVSILNLTLETGTSPKILTTSQFLCWIFTEELGTTLDNYNELANKINL